MAVNEEASLSIIVRARDEASQILQGLGGNLGKLGPIAAIGFTVVGAAILGVGVMATKMAGDFQQATTRLVVEAGESQKAIGSIREELLRLGPEVGKSPKELADGMYYIESAGFHGAAAIEVLRASAIAARVGLSAFTPVADAVTSALNAYGLPASQAVHITDLLTQTVASGKLQMEDLAANIGKLLPVSATAGIGLKEVGAAIATMTMQGTDAAQATTALRFMISNLEAPTKQATTALKDIGLSANEVFNALHDPSKGLHGALQEITDHINTKFVPGSAEAVRAFKEIVGGTRGMTAGLELTGPHFAAFTANLKGMDAASSGTGITMAGWAIVQQNLNFHLDQFKAMAESLLIRLGNYLVPVVTQVVAILTTWLPVLFNIVVTTATVIANIITFADKAGILLPILAGVGAYLVILIVQLGILAVTALVGIVAPALGAVGAFLSLAASEGIFAAITLITISPLLLLGIAIIALVVIGVFLITHWNQVIAVAKEVGKVIMDALGTAFEFIKTAIAGALTFITGVWATIVKTFNDSVDNVVKWITSEIPKIPAQIGFALGYAIGSFIKFGIDLFNWVTTAIPNAISALVAFFVALPGNIWNTLLDFELRLHNFEMDLLAWVMRAVPAAIAAIVNFFAELPGKIWSILLGLAQTLLNIIPSLASNASSAGSNIVTSLWNAVSSLPGKMLELGGDIVRGLWNGISNLGGWLEQQVKNFAGGVVSGIKKALGIGSPSLVAALEIGEPVVNGIVQGITGQAFRVVDAVKAALPNANNMGSGGPLSVGTGIGASLVPAAVGGAGGSQVGPLGGGSITIPVMLNGREIGRAVLTELELVRRLRGGNLAGGA